MPQSPVYLSAGADPYAAAMIGAEHEAIERLRRGEHHLARVEHREADMLGHVSRTLLGQIAHLQGEISHVRHEMHSKHHGHDRHRRTDAAVGIDSGAVLVLPGTTVTILSTPVVPVLIDQLTIPSSIAGFLGIQEIRVGMKPFNAGSSVFSAASFSEVAVIQMAMDIGLVAAGTQIQTTVLWLGAAPARILGSYLGKNLDNPCAPGDVHNPMGHHQGMHQGPHGMHPMHPMAPYLHPTPGLPYHPQPYPHHY